MRTMAWPPFRQTAWEQWETLMHRIMRVDDEQNILNALRRLEEETPGITQVKWGPNGEVLFDADDFKP